MGLFDGYINKLGCELKAGESQASPLKQAQSPPPFCELDVNLQSHSASKNVSAAPMETTFKKDFRPEGVHIGAVKKHIKGSGWHHVECPDGDSEELTFAWQNSHTCLEKKRSSLHHLPRPLQ